MHSEAFHFMEWVKLNFPVYFQRTMVLDIGSADINGNLGDLLDIRKTCEYVGSDVAEGPNVNIATSTSQLTLSNLDTILSSECFEHDHEYKASLQNIVRMLKPNGLLVFTCASTGRIEHGTRRAGANQSLATSCGLEGFQDYYRNLCIEDIAEAIDLSLFTYRSYYQHATADLYFVGLKTSTSSTIAEIPRYHGKYTRETTLWDGGRYHNDEYVTD